MAQQRKVENIANNIANANTAGFKKDTLIFKEELAALKTGIANSHVPQKEWSPGDFYHHHGAEHSFVGIDGSYTQHTQGQLKPTSNPLDVAIKGPGFFEVLTPSGIRYSRNGMFAFSPNGELINQDGHFILSAIEKSSLESDQAPTPEQRKILINLNKKIDISKNGQIYQNGGPISKISLVEFKDLHALKKQGHSLFLNPNNQNIKTNDSTMTMQGYVESSNVNAIVEMSELLKAHRHFESIQKAIKAYDSMAGKSINELSKY
jgi:flagellar basal-body rod protein FlgG